MAGTACYVYDYGYRHCYSLYGVGRKDWTCAASVKLFPMADCHAVLLLYPDAGD